MIKSDLVRGVADKNPHLHAKDAERIVHAFLDGIGAAVAEQFSRDGTGDLGAWL
jgi:nucleoid DNA-binding protein